jgi:preprotein translocase subunit SecD
MTDVRTRLQDADPVATEPQPTDAVRARLRARVVGALDAPRAMPRSASRARRVAIAAAIATGVVIGTSGLWPAFGPPAYAAVRLEVRLAEDAPARTLREAPVGNEPRIVYLHDDAVVTNEQISACRVVPGARTDRFAVEVRLTPEGAAAMRAATRGHVGRPLAILIDGLVVMAPTVRSEIADLGVLTGNFTRADAERIVNGLRSR